MLLPVRTSIQPRRTPYVNYALIAVNAIVFLLTYGPHRHFEGGQVVLVPVRHWVERFMLMPEQWHWWQFITYAFLHGSFLHIFGNMFFLYIFGNNVNDRLGHIGYLGLYLAGGVFAGIGHSVLHSSHVLGASGAVAAVTGAYLALFPQTLITVVYWFFFIGTIEVPALYFIALKLILIDNLIARIPDAIAYDAHLAGYAFGIAVILIALATGLIPGSSFDLWAMVKRWNRRRHYRDVVSGGYDPFVGRLRTKKIEVKEVEKAGNEQAESPQQRKINELRNEISRRVLERNLPAAAELYLELMEIDDKQLLPRQHLLDIANKFASDDRAEEAVKAYEQFLAHYSSYEYAEQVELMLGILYSRHLDWPESAVKHLQAAVGKLSDPGQLKMCQDELARLQS
jgi:membrane associated rhomboid family serine protease